MKIHQLLARCYRKKQTIFIFVSFKKSSKLDSNTLNAEAVVIQGFEFATQVYLVSQFDDLLNFIYLFM